jgi:hypothetical protein
LVFGKQSSWDFVSYDEDFDASAVVLIESGEEGLAK